MKVLFIGARLCRNLGGPSLLVATKKLLMDYLPDTRFVLLVPQKSASEDRALESVYGVSCVPFVSGKRLVVSALMRFLLRLRLGPPEIQAVLDEYQTADVVIDLWGIAFADSLGSNSFRSRLSSGFHLLVGRLAGKKVVKYTAAYGPFETKWNHFFAKLYLNHCVDLILARDQTSRDHLLSLSIKTPLHVCPDTAFLLEPEESTDSWRLVKLREQQPVIGLSVSHQAMNRYGQGASEYVSLTAEFADLVIGKLDGHMVLIPNELSNEDNDDGRIAQAIYEHITQRAAVTLVGREWSAQQLKGIIQQCDVMIATRYHTLVAALSLGIPSLAIGWHHKYHGLLSLVGQERYICDVENLNLEHLLAIFDDLWASRDREAATIRGKLPGIRAAIMTGAEQVSMLLGVSGGSKLK